MVHTKSRDLFKMPLYVCNKLLSDDQISFIDLSQHFPVLKAASIMLSTLPTQELTKDDRYLYINEGEFGGTTPQDDSVKKLATDDATTCHIVVLRHSDTGATCLGHCNGKATARAIDDMISLVKQLSNISYPVIEAHIAGGFLDDSGLSSALSSQILESLHKSSEVVHLKTACCTDLNDAVIDGTHWPLIYGLAVDVASGSMSKVCVQPKDKGPDMAIRSAANVSLDRMVNIYDSSHQCLTFGPYHIRSLDNLDQWLQASDAVLTHCLSTSPQQERAHFATSVRETLTVMKQHPDSMTSIFQGRPRCYRLSADCTWNRLHT